MAAGLHAVMAHATFIFVCLLARAAEGSRSIPADRWGLSNTRLGPDIGRSYGEYCPESSATTFLVDDSSLVLRLNPFDEMLQALETMQNHFFEVWLGQWPDAIDWTAAVLNTYLSAAMSSMLRAPRSLTIDDASSSTSPHMRLDRLSQENMINRYFSQSISYYFAEDAFGIRNEAYDDMLWVVLEWLESIKFMKSHARVIGKWNGSASSAPSTWYGQQFLPGFAHRAYVFYHLARAGWDETLCGGGLTWNPRLQPYKNTITNMLFISASVDMYLHHPGDENSSPYDNETKVKSLPAARAHDARWLDAAIAGYHWLKAVNMTNDYGLYVDGYHIKDWWRGNTYCDQRDEAVYTYNQGVILSGLRSLWESTGNVTYLQDAHELVRNVINATGWSLDDQEVLDVEHKLWHGLGRHGVLTELCDARGDCSQDSQAFKGIFFKHLTDLCSKLPTDESEAMVPGTTYVADEDLAELHRHNCTSYVRWVAHNAIAAMATRDEEGIFGMWWDTSNSDNELQSQHKHLPQSPLLPPASTGHSDSPGYDSPRFTDDTLANNHGNLRIRRPRDPNDRGRGRTLETQSGGLMVVRALHEFLQRYGNQA